MNKFRFILNIYIFFGAVIAAYTALSIIAMYEPESVILSSKSNTSDIGLYRSSSGSLIIKLAIPRNLFSDIANCNPKIELIVSNQYGDSIKILSKETNGYSHSVSSCYPNITYYPEKSTF